ncbi:nucleotide-sugar transporter-domain-containing protein [Melampsora americana]|nr:nucleotide-sugar transporter-domain-containing protein [Melampsora americana]
MSLLNSSSIRLPFGIQIQIKYLSLFTLTLQNSLLTILLHYSRNTPYNQSYSAPAAVLLNEILKCLISLLIAIYNSYKNSCSIENRSDDKLGQFASLLSNHPDSIDSPKSDHSALPLSNRSRSSIDSNPQLPNPFFHLLLQQILQTFKLIISRDCWKLSIPAILYVIQNNLQFVAASHLDVATFSVTYQLKILTTALCSVLMLGRRLSTFKWVSLFFLAIGVALVQVQNSPPPTQDSTLNKTSDRLIGFIAVTAACFTSGLAGVYFELVLKSSTKVDLWIRNVQLSLFSLLPALFTAFYYSPHPEHHGMFTNFGLAAWATVLTQVIGGLVTALVIKFADNILKGFATSLSIILSTFASVLLFNAPLPLGSAIGASVVLLATYSYNHPAAADRPTSTTTLPIRMPPKIPAWREQSGSKKDYDSSPLVAPLGIGIDLQRIESTPFGTNKYQSTFPSLQFNPSPASNISSVLIHSRRSSETNENGSNNGSPARYLISSAHSRLSTSREIDKDLNLDEKSI